MRKRDPMRLRMFVAIGPERCGAPKKRKDLAVTSAMPIVKLLVAESYQYEEEEVDEDDGDSELEPNPLGHEGRDRLLPDLDSEQRDMIVKWAETAEPGDMLTVNPRAVIVCVKARKQIVEHRKLGLETV